MARKEARLASLELDNPVRPLLVQDPVAAVPAPNDVARPQLHCCPAVSAQVVDAK